MVVEDEVLIRMGLANALRGAGYAVIEACNGAEAMDVVESGISPDVLVADVLMPGHIDGLQLAALLEATLPNLIVFLMSGKMIASDLRLRMNFLPKPVDPDLVVERIARKAPPPVQF